MWCFWWFKWSFYAYEQCWQKSIALEIQTDSNLSDFFGFCDHRFSPYAEKIQNYFIGCGNLMLQGSSTSKNMPHWLKVLKMWSSVPQVCHMDKMDMEQSAHDKTVHKNMMTIAKLQQWLVSGGFFSKHWGHKCIWWWSQNKMQKWPSTRKLSNKTLPKAQRIQGIEWIDSTNTFSSKQLQFGCSTKFENSE